MITIDELKLQLKNKSRLIGIDMGSKRIGISICDENRKIATPYETIFYENIEKLISKINDIIVENNIKGIVVGLPLNMDGSEGRSVQSVKDKMKLITEKINIPVVLWDERLSTVGSFNISSQLDINTSKKLKDIDKNSAAFILQGSLDYLNK
jgi:putative Holliday junction resolvase|tara:strand:+ start:1380 stop:1835 length:456 start_codon:yes stop_codon:yes gene_type:complete